MSYCSKCGREHYSDGTVCTQCVKNNYPSPNLNTPYSVMMPDHSGKAVTSLVLGIISIFGLVSPVVGFITSIIGIMLGVKGRKSKNKGIATAGLVLGIVFLICSILNWLISFAVIAFLWSLV